MQYHGQQHQPHVVEEVAPVARHGPDDETDQADKAEDAHGLVHPLRETRQLLRTQNAQRKRQPDDGDDVPRHLQRVERNTAQQRRRRGVQTAPEREVERHEHNGQRVGDRRHRHRQRHIAPGPVREDIAHIARRAARHQDHAQRNAGAGLEQQREHKGHGRQHDELRRNAHRHRTGHAQHALEVGHARIERNAEHEKTQHHVERHQRRGVEVEAYFVDGQHGGPFRPKRRKRCAPRCDRCPCARSTPCVQASGT